MEIARDASGNAVRIRMRMPADLHHHFRMGARTKLIAPMVAKRFWLALEMPNHKPPITTFDVMNAHRQEVVDASGGKLRVLSTLYLTDTLDPREVEKACEDEDFAGIKYYPAGLTTNSDAGVVDPTALWTPGTRPFECLRVLSEAGRVLLLHAADGVARKYTQVRTRLYDAGEELDVYDQEPHFVAHTLPEIMDHHDDLRISFEHLSTGEGAEFMREHGDSGRLGCGLTPQHMLNDRRDTFRRGFNPHTFWFPATQDLEHRQEINRFAAEGWNFCWLASDSAMHLKKDKESACCSGGVITAHAGIELYVEAFEKIGALEKLEDFASVNGPRFYGIEPSKRTIDLVKEPWQVKDFFYVEEDDDLEPVHPFRLGETIPWKLVD